MYKNGMDFVREGVEADFARAEIDRALKVIDAQRKLAALRPNDDTASAKTQSAAATAARAQKIAANQA